MSLDNRPLIRASEFAEYGFCERTWWLARVKKVPPANRGQLRRGVRLHHQHGRQVRAATRWRRISAWLFAAGILALAILLLLNAF